MELTASERQAAGAQALGGLVTYWLSRGQLSHDRLAAIMDWGLGERCSLHGAALSRIRNGSQPRGAGLQHLDAMAQANEAIWCWQVQGPEEAIRQFGPHSSWGVKGEWLDGAVWLPRPDDENEPLDLGDLAMVVAGRMTLPYVAAGISSPGQAQRINAALVALLDHEAMEHGWSPSAAMRRFAEAYPSTDIPRRYRLKLLIMQEATLTADELEGEMAALAEMVRVVRELEEFTPADLERELLSWSGGRSA